MADQGATPSLLVLPKNSTEDGRILTLAHPRTSRPSRYYFDPHNGIYEFTRIAAPKASCRSWLLKSRPKFQPAQQKETEGRGERDQHANSNVESIDELSVNGATAQRLAANAASSDYISKNAELLVATPIDPLFILLPSLFDKKLFLSADDLLDRLSERSKHFTQITAHEQTRSHLEIRLTAVCDTVDVGDEQMYRLNEGKLLTELCCKAKNIVSSGLPPSMEERFVRKALEAPLAVIKREESSISEAGPGIDTPLSEAAPSESVESQTSEASAYSISTVASSATDITIPDDTNAKDSVDLHHHLRLRTALAYMISSYVPSNIAASLIAAMASEKSPLDFKPLDIRLAEIAKLRAEALSARSIGDFSRKRNAHEEDDAAESRLEKKRRKEEEEKKKKAGETRGIRDLKKVDTKGMKKMSDFFGKRVSPRKKYSPIV